MPFGPLVSVGPVQQQDADDLAEGERHDRQVVAAQPQHREAQHDAPEGGEDAGQRQADPEGQAEILRQQGVGIGADGVEGDVAEVEQPGQADHDVQPPAEHDVGQHQDADIELVAADAGDEGQHQRRGQQRRGDQLAGLLQPVRPGAGRGARLQRAAAGKRGDRQPPGEDDAAEQRHLPPALPQDQAALRPDLGPQPDQHDEKPEGDGGGDERRRGVA